MAKMYPPNKPASTKSNAERLLYPIFKEKLDDSYHVYHSRWWQFKKRTGEIDFLVVHPNKGLIIVEVKGGKIQYDNFSDAWYSNTNKLSKSPYIQAEDTCRELMRFLQKNYIFFQSLNFTYKFCVCFPDIDEVRDLPSIAKGKTLTGNDLDNLQEKIEIILDSSPKGRDKLGEIGLKELYKIIAPESEFITYDINAIDRNKEIVNSFTEDQEIILEELMDFPQVTVLGCAGSGKTQLALTKVRELVRQKNRVLITCKSDNLAGWIYSRLQEFAKNQNEYSLQVLRFHKLRKLLEKNEELEFDAIIIDEGQDFKSEEIKYLKKLLKNEDESIFYIFQDDNQNISQNPLNNKIPIHPRKLITNLRNTRQVFDYFRPFVDGKIKKTHDNDGPEVKQINFENKEKLFLQLEKELQELKFKKIKPSMISLLTNIKNQNNSILFEKKALGGYDLQYFDCKDYLNNNNRDKVKWSTVEEFKGLENDIIFFIQENPMSFMPTQQDISDKYVGYSRARWRLIDFINCCE